MSVIEEVAAERRRQVEVEGFDAAHDDGHTAQQDWRQTIQFGKVGDLARAGACYALSSVIPSRQQRYHDGLPIRGAFDEMCVWPWSREWWKPKDRRRDLIRAAALIVAEIERLDRLSAASR